MCESKVTQNLHSARQTASTKKQDGAVRGTVLGWAREELTLPGLVTCPTLLVRQRWRQAAELGARYTHCGLQGALLRAAECTTA